MPFWQPQPRRPRHKTPSTAFSWPSNLPFASPQTLQMPFWQSQPRRPRYKNPINSFFWRSNLPFASPQTLQMPFWHPQPYRPRHQNPTNSFILAFKPVVYQPSNPPNNLQTKAPRPAGAEATYYVPTNIISHRRKGCDGPSKIAILPQFLTFNVHFVRKGYDGPKKTAILPQFLTSKVYFVRKGFVSWRSGGTAPALRERWKEEREKM